MVKFRLAYLVLTAITPFAAAPAAAQDFNCRNEAAEIRCQKLGCQVATQDFTPMSLSRTGAKLEICAYSGCWQGRIEFRRTRGAVTMLLTTVRGGEPLSVIYDAPARTALMRWGDFAQPMTCGKTQ